MSREIYYNIQMQLEWVSEHMNIKENELADKAAKKEIKLQRTAIEKYISIAYIKRKIKESALIDWINIWQASKAKEKHYSQYECRSKWKTKAKILKKQIWSTYIQLKLDHDYFKSYLNRLSNYDSNICQFCNTKKSSEHLLLFCRRYSQIRSKIKKEKQLNQLSSKILFDTIWGQDFLFEFLKETSIVTRKWLLQIE